MSDTTQVESLKTLMNSGRGETVDAAVLANIKALGPVCRAVLCKAANISVSTACGSVGRLKAKGLVTEAADKVWYVETKRNVTAYVATTEGEPHATQ